MAGIMILIVLFLLSLPTILLLTKSRRSSERLPPGSLGIPVIGQSLSLLRAMWASKAEEWVARRIEKYGPVSKLSLFGSRAVLLTGPAANKFMFTNPDIVLQQPKSITELIGKRNMMELVGVDHRRVRGAVEQFLKPDMLKKYVGRIDGEVRSHIEKNWSGRQVVKVLPLAKILTFDLICSVIVGIERGAIRDKLLNDLRDTIDGMWAIPVDLPFTNFRKSLRASCSSRKVLTGLVQERRSALEKGLCDSNSKDLINYLISLRNDDDGSETLTDEEIVDNVVLILVAGYETSSILITFMIRHLANDPVVYDRVIQEQEEIAKSKASPEDALTWDDILKMKYTWRFALEILRTIPPVFGGFRRAVENLEYNGYLIPKGWQVFWVANVTHMDAKLFQDPEKCDPTRFENPLSVPSYSFVPFGGGPRICPGNEFAKLETVVMMHYVVTKFNWKLCCKNDVYRRDPMPSPSEGLPIQLEPKTSLSKISK